MEDDLVVVDDEQAEQNPAAEAASESVTRTPKTLSEQAIASSSRLRAREKSAPANASPAADSADRNTRARVVNKPQPKLKLKLSEKAAAQAPGNSFLGPYDRELDSDDEDLAFEEQFILRFPPGEDCEKLRKMITSREVTPDVWFKFKDSRRAVFHIGENMYSAKLVDLPCIIEGQKTLDNKQMFKIADICQMLVVEGRIGSEDQVTSNKNFNVDEFIWPHGITPPLHHVRKRRFRQRMNRRAIESVEEEVERLLKADEMATQVKYDVLENVNPDLSDSEFIERDEPMDAATPALSDMGDPSTPMDDSRANGGANDGGDEEGDIDEELAAELDLALVDEEEADDEDDDESDDEDDEDDDEDDETSQARKLINEEIRDLETAVAKKRNDVASASNPLIKKRFEDMLKKLSADLEMKIAQRDEMRRQEADPNIDPNAPQTRGQSNEDDLFGSDMDSS